MMIWIIARKERFDSYSHKRFAEVFENKNIDFRLFDADELSVTIMSGKLEISRGDEILSFPDLVIPRSSEEKALNLYAALENYNIKFLNQLKSVLIAKNKWKTLAALGGLGFPIPKTSNKMNLPKPCVLKKNISSRGRDVFLIEEDEDIIFDKEGEYLFQEYLKHSHGQDIRVLVIGGKIIGSIKRSNKGNFLANISQNGKAEKTVIPKKYEKMILKAIKTLGLNYAGVDLLIDKNGYKFCEINWAADFEGFEKATGIDVPEKILDFMEVLLEPPVQSGLILKTSTAKVGIKELL